MNIVSWCERVIRAGFILLFALVPLCAKHLGKAEAPGSTGVGLLESAERSF